MTQGDIKILDHAELERACEAEVILPGCVDNVGKNNSVAVHEVISVTSECARWRLISLASRLFSQPCIHVQIKENIKASFFFFFFLGGGGG